MTLVHAPACHFCVDAEEAISESAVDRPIVVRRVDARSPEGRELLQIHRAAMTPLVLIDDTYISAGRLPRGKVRKLLDRHPSSVEV